MSYITRIKTKTGDKQIDYKSSANLPKEINNGINQHRHDIKFMSKLYQKYKNELPYYLRMELYKLTLNKNMEVT